MFSVGLDICDCLFSLSIGELASECIAHMVKVHPNYFSPEDIPKNDAKSIKLRSPRDESSIHHSKSIPSFRNSGASILTVGLFRNFRSFPIAYFLFVKHKPGLFQYCAKSRVE